MATGSIRCHVHWHIRVYGLVEGRQAGRQERLDHGRKVFCRGGKGKGSASPNTPGSGSYDGGRLIAAAEGLLLALL